MGWLSQFTRGKYLVEKDTERDNGDSKGGRRMKNKPEKSISTNEEFIKEHSDKPVSFYLDMFKKISWTSYDLKYGCVFCGKKITHILKNDTPLHKEIKELFVCKKHHKELFGNE